VKDYLERVDGIAQRYSGSRHKGKLLEFYHLSYRYRGDARKFLAKGDSLILKYLETNE
jgi:hypothetical protein